MKIARHCFSILLALICAFCFAFNSSAANNYSNSWRTFTTQSASSYTSHTYAVQSILYRYNVTTSYYIQSSGGIDGSFGTGTENAVRAFQSCKGLSVDGIVGPNTWYSLCDSLYVSGSSNGVTYLAVSNGVYSTNAIKRTVNATVSLWYAHTDTNCWIPFAS